MVEELSEVVWATAEPCIHGRRLVLFAGKPWWDQYDDCFHGTVIGWKEGSKIAEQIEDREIIVLTLCGSRSNEV